MIDMNELLKQAKSVQEKMDQMHKKRSELKFEGKSGGDLVVATVNGEKQVVKIDVDKSIIQAEEKEIMEDLIVAALNDAFAKADKSAKNEMSSVFSGFGLPPGTNLPF